jgi:hypothetical protein
LNTVAEITSHSPLRQAGPTQLPDHLIGFPGGMWAFWRWVCLRGAGFPLALVQELASPEAAVAADDLLAAQKHLDAQKQSLVEAIRHELDVTADDQKRKQLARMLTHLNKGRISEAWEAAVERRRTEFIAARESCIQARERFQRIFRTGIDEVSERIEKLALNPDFRRAVLLQNRKALHHGIDLLLRRDAGNRKRGKKERQQEELVASYIQRYCVKNDSIGFFGPIGWARFVPEGENISVRPGPSLIAKSTVYFENWCIEALAESIGAHEALKPWIPPRHNPLSLLDGNRLQMPGGSPMPLSPAQLAVLRRCNGEKPARQIALELIKIPGSGVRAEEDVYRILQEFVERGAVRWQFEIPYLLYPEQKLRSMLERIDDETLRASTLDSLNQLEQAREQVSSAIDDAEQLDKALGNLDETFTRLTGKSSSRASGAMYAARTLVYLDCLRDVQLEVGPQLIAQTAEPLSVILTGARWFTARAVALYRQAFLQIYADLARKKRSSTVDFLSFWLQAQPLLVDPANRLLNQVVPEFQQRWDEIFQPVEGQRHLNYSSAELRPRADSLFSVPRAGWERARHHSPDVMVAAESVEAIRKGDYLLVMGELHMAINTVRGSFAMSQHPHPEQMFAGMKSDFPAPQIVPVVPKWWPGSTMRTSYTLISPYDYFLEATEDSISTGPKSQTFPISAFVIDHAPTGLIVRSRDGRVKFDLIEGFGEVLSAEAVDCAKIVRSVRHQPRITIDRLVICRESWSFSAEELKFALLEDESERFLAARGWQQEHNLPRYAFIRVLVEVKPCYVDFDSPVYVGIFAKLVRRVLASQLAEKSITISEMLPTPDQIWLPDAAGRKHTCEFRTIVLDLAGKPDSVFPDLFPK